MREPSPPVCVTHGICPTHAYAVSPKFSAIAQRIAHAGQDRLVGQSTGEVYVDAKEVLTPPASLIEEAHDSAQLLDTVNPFSA